MAQDQLDEYDAIIVGSGPGGATVGRELSRAGQRVLILERGKDHQDLGSYRTAMRALDMGRSVRVATPAQRRVLAVRDRHCRFPSCGRKPQWCDAHHIAGWVESLGRTDIDNLILLCRRHHTLLHNSRWSITRTAAGEFEFTHPARGP